MSKIDLNEMLPLFFYMLMKREGGLVKFDDKEFEQYTQQKIRMGCENVPGGVNIFLVEGD